MARLLLSTLGALGQLRLWSVGLVLWGAGMILAPSTARADTRAFSICFTSGVRSCTWLELTTTAFFAGSGERIGTGIEVLVRHDEGAALDNAAVVSALTGFHFAYAGAAVAPLSDADVSDELGLVAPLVLTKNDVTAPWALYADGWRHSGRSSTTTSSSPEFDNYLAFTNVLNVDDGSGTLLTQYVGGCGTASQNGDLDLFYRTELWTCGDGSYQFLTFTEAWFDASDVNAVGVSTWARFGDSDIGVAAFCTRYLDSGTSFGDADGSFTALSDVCSDGSIIVDPPVTTVPEPGALPLVSLAGAFLIVFVWQHRKRTC